MDVGGCMWVADDAGIFKLLVDVSVPVKGGLDVDT